MPAPIVDGVAGEDRDAVIADDLRAEGRGFALASDRCGRTMIACAAAMAAPNGRMGDLVMTGQPNLPA
ncbi:MAG: hypothetical protein EBR23_01885 [Planctomycetia bacterium]|nr:hypothetical protein [Planctomycetia bacterium]